MQKNKQQYVAPKVKVVKFHVENGFGSIFGQHEGFLLDNTLFGHEGFSGEIGFFGHEGFSDESGYFDYEGLE